jgi:hypothetical protein
MDSEPCAAVYNVIESDDIERSVILYSVSILFLHIWKDPLIHRRANTECAVGYYPDDKQHDERFPERETE